MAVATKKLLGYKVTVPGFDNTSEFGVVVTTTRGKAKANAYRSLRDVGYGYKYTDIRATRYPEYDNVPNLHKHVYTLQWAALKKKEHEN